MSSTLERRDAKPRPKKAGSRSGLDFVSSLLILRYPSATVDQPGVILNHCIILVQSRWLETKCILVHEVFSPVVHHPRPVAPISRYVSNPDDGNIYISNTDDTQ